KSVCGATNPSLFDEQLVRTLTDLDLPRDSVGLTRLIKRHDDNAGTIAMDRARFLQEVRFPFLQADGIDDALSLHALKAGFQYRPLRAVDHHRYPGDLGLGRNVVEDRRHRLLGVEHALVHVD